MLGHTHKTHTNRHLTPRSVLWQAGYLLLLLSTVVTVAYMFGERLLYELRGPLTIDSTLYMGVGRGIVNGLLPYIDLFETKPPGVFLLAGLSFWLTNGDSLLPLMQIGVLLLFPLSTLYVVRHMARQFGSTPYRTAAVGTAAVLFSVIMTLYSAERSGEFQVESFGAALGTVYLAIVAVHARLTRRQLLLAAGFLMAAVGMKEPFLLSILGGALLVLADEPQQWKSHLLQPLLLAAVLGVAALWWLGYASGYFSVYLPEMMGNHIHAQGSPFVRALAWHRLYGDLQAYMPLLAQGVVLLLLISVSAHLHSWSWRQIGRVIGAAVLAVYLASMAVGMGGQYWNHHFIFAVPLYMGAAFAAVRYGLLLEHPETHRLEAGVLVTAAVLSLQLPPSDHFQARLDGVLTDVNHAKATAKEIDRVLDSCELDTYLFFGPNGYYPYAFTEHSPMGPTFFQYNYLLDENRPHFRQALLRNMREARLVVWHSYQIGDLQDIVDPYLKKHFTYTPWKCAGEPGFGEEYFVLYRRQK